MRQRVGGHDASGADGPQRPDEQEADGPRAVDPSAHARPDVAEVDGVEAHAERLEQRDIVALDRVGDRQQQTLRPAHERAQAAVDGSVTAEPDVRAEVAVAGPADEAVSTRVRRLHDDPLALARAGDDEAAHLVAEHERLDHLRLADAAVLVPVEVGAAQPDGGDADELLPRRGDGLGFLVDTDVAGAVQSKHFHAGHDRRWHASPRGGSAGLAMVRARTGRRQAIAYPAVVTEAACRARLVLTNEGALSAHGHRARACLRLVGAARHRGAGRPRAHRGGRRPRGRQGARARVRIGQDAIWLAQGGWNVTAVDGSSGSVTEARMAAAAAGVTIAFHVAELASWRPASRYDLVVLTDSLPERGKGRSRTLEMAAAAVAPGGTILVSDLDVSLGREGWMAEKHLVSREELERHLDGFRILRSTTRVARRPHGYEELVLPVAHVVARRRTDLRTL